MAPATNFLPGAADFQSVLRLVPQWFEEVWFLNWRLPRVRAAYLKRLPAYDALWHQGILLFIVVLLTYVIFYPAGPFPFPRGCFIMNMLCPSASFVIETRCGRSGATSVHTLHVIRYRR
jgi:hypothetical protein